MPLHLQKSFSDGRLVEEEMDSNVPNTQVKPQKAVKFLQTLPPSTVVNQSEDSEVSDRDLPELAPINIQDYQRKGEFKNLACLFFKKGTLKDLR